MNTIDLLMKMDAGALDKIPEEEREIPRLSELTGGKFVIKYKALPGQRITEISRMAGESIEKEYDAQLLLICEAMVYPDLKNKELMEHFKVPTPKDLANKLFNGGEAGKISKAIMALSGYTDDTDEQIKN
ncbi:MAG: hypothetical protein IJV14_11035 [Lachnospiraceae bacterium]|nr:hypothetical protein [Lachnospiraceae bacterium]